MLRACLALLLLTCAVSPVLAQNGRGENAASAASGRGTGTSPGAPQAKPASANGYVHPAAPATSQGGGGSDEETVLRMRVPKWNSFLPGMFR
jgi:hypothetical protein